jgi:2-C-methyl-D-erythritol 2,4-cyclodiphosphate synthase
VRAGFGEDRHPLSAATENRPFLLAGVQLASCGGPAGHSDGDPLCHAVIDALLGAAGLGTIGDLFPDTDPRWKDRSGLELLERTVRVLSEAGWSPVNVDAVVVADSPRLAPHAAAIRAALARALGLDPADVSVKGKRAEGLGFEGSGLGVSSRAIVLIGARGAR